MKAIAYGTALKALPKQVSGTSNRGNSKPKPIQDEIDRGTMNFQNQRAELVPGGYTEVEFYRDGITGKRKVRALRVNSEQGLELSENALGILYAHEVISSQERRAGDLWAIGGARDRGSVHPKIGMYEERIPDSGGELPPVEQDVWRSIHQYRKGRKLLQGMGTRVYGQVWGVAIESRLPGWFQRQRSMVVRPSDDMDQKCLHRGLEELIELYEVS